LNNKLPASFHTHTITVHSSIIISFFVPIAPSSDCWARESKLAACLVPRLKTLLPFSGAVVKAYSGTILRRSPAFCFLARQSRLPQWHRVLPAVCLIKRLFVAFEAIIRELRWQNSGPLPDLCRPNTISYRSASLLLSFIHNTAQKQTTAQKSM